MKHIIYTTPETYNKNSELDEEILTGQVAYLLKDNGDDTGLFSVRTREDGERVDRVLPFSYVTRHEVDFPHENDVDTERELIKKGALYLTVGKLREFLETYKDELDDDGIVYYERIEDVYFEEYGWKGRIKYDTDFCITPEGDLNPLDFYTNEYIPATWCYSGNIKSFKIVDRNLYITSHI